MGDLARRIKREHIFEGGVIPKFPRRNLLIDITNFCNHECIFCYHRKMSRKQRFIDEDIVLKALKEAYLLGSREVGFYATGEPLLNKNLSSYIKTAKEIGYEYTYITTNGSLLDIYKAKELISSGLDSIKFSINGGSAGSYKNIHGKDDYHKVIENLIQLSNYKKANDLKLRIYISFIVTSVTKQETDNFYLNMKQYVDDIVFFNVRNQTGLMYDDVTKLLVDDPRTHIKDFVPCPTVFNAITITCEGFVSACCADFQNYLIVGDLRKQSLKEIWQSESFCGLRKAHLQQNLENTICYNCVYHANKKVKPLTEMYATMIKDEEGKYEL